MDEGELDLWEQFFSPPEEERRLTASEYRNYYPSIPIICFFFLPLPLQINISILIYGTRL